VTPEGYKLGTICILDTVARPHGLNQEQLSTLSDLADMTVKVMVDRRYQLNKKKNEQNPTQKFTYTAHDLMAPLVGIQASLSVLKDDSVVKEVLGEHQFELLCTAAACSELMIRICKDAVDGLNLSGYKNSTEAPNCSSTRNEVSNRSIPLTNVEELVKSLQMIAEPIAKVPCMVTLDKALPNVIVGDDLKLFRSTVNLLTSAIDRTSTGMVHLSIRLDESVVLFECEDTGEDIPVEEYQFLFQPGGDAVSARVGLSSIANLIESLGGEYGFRPRDGYAISKCSGRRRSGSIFWFSIPLILPEMLDNSHRGMISTSMVDGKIEPIDTSHRLETEIQSTSLTATTLCAGSSFMKDVDREAQTTRTNFSLSKSKITSAEVATLATNLDVPLADLEPVPLNGLMSGITSNNVRRRRALVIDDSVVVRRSLVRTLNSLGFDVIQADDGEEGLKELKQFLFDLVLCEFSLPVMNGVTYVQLMDCMYNDFTHLTFRMRTISFE
jgi:signal transduction histidine kinase/CheY-like chemotaxis protein